MIPLTKFYVLIVFLFWWFILTNYWKHFPQSIYGEFISYFCYFQTCSQSGFLVNVITSQVLLVWCCNLIVVFFTSIYWTSSILTFLWPFWTFRLAQGQVALWTQWLLRNRMHHVVTLLCRNCLYRVVILQRYSSHQNLGRVRCWPLLEMTNKGLPVSFCNFTEMLSTSKSQTSWMLTFVWPFCPFELGHGQMAVCCSSLWIW